MTPPPTGWQSSAGMPPDAPDDATVRTIPGLRALRTSVRTAHVVAVAIFYGGHVYGVAPERLTPALTAVLATGFAFATLEVVRAPVWLAQVRGLAVYAKVGLMLTADAVTALRIPALSLAMVLGVVVSHMPARYRYYSLVHGRRTGHEDKG